MPAFRSLKWPTLFMKTTAAPLTYQEVWQIGKEGVIQSLVGHILIFSLPYTIKLK